MGRPQPKSKTKRRNSKLPRRRSKPKRRRKTPTKKPKRQARSNSFDHGSARRSSLALPSYPRLLTSNKSRCAHPDDAIVAAVYDRRQSDNLRHRRRSAKRKRDSAQPQEDRPPLQLGVSLT